MTCCKAGTWDRFLYFPSGGRHAEDFYVRKIQRLRPGLNPETWVPAASVLTTRPPKPSTLPHTKMYYSSKPVLKEFKTFKTLRYVSISYEIILREFVISLLRLLSLKFTKNVKDPLWLCGSIRLVCLHCVLHGNVSWTGYCFS